MHAPIDNIQIVTNGTILFRDDIIPILRNSKVSVDISYYGGPYNNYRQQYSFYSIEEIAFFLPDFSFFLPLDLQNLSYLHHTFIHI